MSICPDTSSLPSVAPSTPTNLRSVPVWSTLKDKRNAEKVDSCIGSSVSSHTRSVVRQLFKSTGEEDIMKPLDQVPPLITSIKKKPEWRERSSKKVLCPRADLERIGQLSDELLWKIGSETSPMMSSSEIMDHFVELRPIIWSLKLYAEGLQSTGVSQAWESLTERGKRLDSIVTQSPPRQSSGMDTEVIRTSLLTNSGETLRSPTYSDGLTSIPSLSKSRVEQLYSKPSRFGLLVICTLLSGIQLWISLQKTL